MDCATIRPAPYQVNDATPTRSNSGGLLSSSAPSARSAVSQSACGKRRTLDTAQAKSVRFNYRQDTLLNAAAKKLSGNSLVAAFST